VDNEHFRGQGCVPESTSFLRPPSADYFLASARFIAKKNLPLLLHAYAQYRAAIAGNKGQGTEVMRFAAPWPLVILGDGPLRETLKSQITDLHLQDVVLLPGFLQYDELPAWYSRAGAFVHASTTEQWGLVVNEAVAAGLPVLISERCGCVPELVQEGVNGFVFDPTDLNALATCLLKMTTLSAEDRARFGAASREIASHYEPECFGEGLRNAAELALKLPRARAGIWDRLLLNRLAT
jgi:glycosyltransferase involved in cell wall biosynthesis